MKKRGKDQKDWLFRGQNAPTTKVLRMFTDYYISREHNHRLQSGEKTKRKKYKTPTIRSVHTFFDTFCAGFKYETRNEIPREVKAYIKAVSWFEEGTVFLVIEVQYHSILISNSLEDSIFLRRRRKSISSWTVT